MATDAEVSADLRIASKGAGISGSLILLFTFCTVLCFCGLPLSAAAGAQSPPAPCTPVAPVFFSDILRLPRKRCFHQ
jgi:hypothetical protein